MQEPASKRFLIAVGTVDPGQRSRLPRLPSVSADLQRVRELFVGDLGYEDVVLDQNVANLDLTAEQISRGLLAWRQRTPAGACGAVVFYFSGHAVARGRELRLCTRGFAAQLLASGLDVGVIAECLDCAAPKIWIILDVCSAGAGATSLVDEAAQAMNREGGLWFLASSGGRVPSYEGVFSAAFVTAARACPRPYETFVEVLESELGRCSAGTQRAHQLIAGRAVVFDLFGDVPLSPPSTQKRNEGTTFSGRGLVASCAAFALVISALFLASNASKMRDAKPTPVPQTVAPAPMPNATPVESPAMMAALRAPNTTSQVHAPTTAKMLIGALQSKAAAPAPSDAPRSTELAFGAVGTQPSTSGTGLLVRVLTKRRGHLVAVNARQPLRSGELFGMHVVLSESAYVGVLHVGTDGRVMRLYPAARELLLVEGVPTRVPPENEGDFQVDDEVGFERFIVFSAVEPIGGLDPADIARQIRSEVRWPESWPVAGKNEQAVAAHQDVVVRGSFFRPRQTRAQALTVVAAVLLEIGHARLGPGTASVQETRASTTSGYRSSVPR